MKAYKNNDHETRISIIETLVSQTSQTLLRLEKNIDGLRSDFEKQFDKIDKRFEKIESKIDKIDSKFESKTDKFTEKLSELRKESTSHFRATIFTLLTLIGTPLFMESLKLLTKFIHG